MIRSSCVCAKCNFGNGGNFAASRLITANVIKCQWIVCAFTYKTHPRDNITALPSKQKKKSRDFLENNQKNLELIFYLKI